MKKILLVLFLLLITTAIKPQVTEEWVARYNGPANGFDGAIAIAVDNDGNVYVGGSSTDVNGINRDFVTIKYNSAGVQQWVRNYNGPGNGDDAITSIAVDPVGNVFVSGFSKGVETREDIATIKYDPSGAMQWVRRYNGPANLNDNPSSMEVDNLGNVYVLGNSRKVNDDDFVTIKYSSNGTEQWQQIYSGPDNSVDSPVSMAVDNAGNVCLAGYSRTYDIFGFLIGSTYTTVKYNNNGLLKWVKTYGTISEKARAMAIDSEGNIYVTGVSFVGVALDFATVKYDSTGLQQWVQFYNGPGNADDYANSITVDRDGNIYVTGLSWVGPVPKYDFTTVKYNSAGELQWVKNYNGPGSDSDTPNFIKTDETGNVYVTGYSIGIGTDWDYTTIKYKSNGDTVWVQRYNGPGNSSDGAYGLAIDGNNNVYITGNSYGGATESDIATIKYSQPPPLQITKPTPYGKFIAGEKDTIKWTDPGWVSINIKCVLNSETPLESELILAQGIPNVNSKFVWNVHDTTLSFRSKIIIENADNTTEKIESDIFRIKPYVLTRLNPDSTYYEYRKNRDQWGFSNIPNDMWDLTWYSQFNYQGIDPFTNQQYSQIQGDSVFFKRPNYAHTDWVSWVNTFTVDACYFSVANGWYKPTATLKWWIKSFPGIWNGSCFGIAVANALAFSNREQFQTKYQNFPAFVNPITVVSDTGVKRVVNELFTYQFGNPHQALRTLIGLEKTPNETLIDLKEMFAQDNSEVRTLSFLNNGGGGGHAVLAYGLKQDPTIDGLYYVHIYDNSNPNSNIPIQISTVSNGGNGVWGTAEPSWAGWGGNKWLYLRNPTEQYLVNPTLAKGVAQQSPFILDQDVLEINHTNSASIQILDNLGNQTGFINNLVQLDIPGSAPYVFDNGSETPPYGYTLPADNYSIVLNEFIEDTVATFFFTGNKSFLYERSGADQTQTDRLFFDGGVSAANPDAQTKTIKLLNLINETTQEKLFVARSLELAHNDSVKIENPDSNKVKLISYGTSKNYDIELNYVTENGIGRFGDFDIQLPANTSHTFVPVWTDLTNTELQVLVDIGNDGTIDDTLSLVNQVTGIGEDQGSLLTPDSYNLAQNYPNPFNPTTTIKYSIPNSGSVILKVYDVLGNEVATLVDEFREAGRYEITFDASNLASGIYFYRLQVGSFVETKKMILLR